MNSRGLIKFTNKFDMRWFKSVYYCWKKIIIDGKFSKIIIEIIQSVQLPWLLRVAFEIESFLLHSCILPTQRRANWIIRRYFHLLMKFPRKRRKQIHFKAKNFYLSSSFLVSQWNYRAKWGWSQLWFHRKCHNIQMF